MVGNEANNQWSEEVIISLEEQANTEKTPDSFIKLLLICWYLILEKGSVGVMHDISDDFLLEKIHDNHQRADKLFLDSHRYMFYTGWMLNISPWYFGINNDELGNDLMLKAMQRKPDNPMYKWACRGMIGLSEAAVTELVEEVSDTEFESLGITIWRYFREMVKP